MLNLLNYPKIILGHCDVCEQFSFLVAEYNLADKDTRPNPWNTYVCFKGCDYINDVNFKNETINNLKVFFNELDEKILKKYNNINDILKNQRLLPEFIIEKIIYQYAISQFIDELNINKDKLNGILTKYFALGYCNDCGRYGLTWEVNACPEGEVGYGPCCVKNVCYHYCYILCPNNHWNKIDSGAYHDDHSCYECDEIIPMIPLSNYNGSPFGQFSWWGMSPEQYMDKYDL